MSQQVLNTLRNVCERSEHRFQKKLYFAPKNCFLSLFSQTVKWKWLFEAIFLNLILKYYKKQIAFKCHFHFAVHEKRLKKQYFGVKYNFNVIFGVCKSCKNMIFLGYSGIFCAWVGTLFARTLVFSRWNREEDENNEPQCQVKRWSSWR